MKIAICDDEIKDIRIIESYIKSHDKCHDITEFMSAVPLLEQLNEGIHYDLLFLDIQMPDSNGWEVARQLKRSKIKIYIAMITVMSDYIFHCFDRVDWFAPKPVSEEKIHHILNNAEEKLFPPIIKFKTDKIFFELTASEISHVEVKINNTYIHTISEVYKIRSPLKEIKNMLSNSNFFVQTHQSYIVNLEYYERLDGTDIILRTGTRVPLSRSWRDEFFTSVSEFIKRA